MESPHPCLMPRAFWDCRPGEPGRVLVLGSDIAAQRLRRLLPPAWPMVAVPEPEAVLRKLGNTSLLCVSSWTGSADPEIWRETARLCAGLSIPIVGVPVPGQWHREDVAKACSLLRPQDLLLAETDSPQVISRWLLKKSTARFWPALSATGLERAPPVPLLRAALRLITRRAQEGATVSGLTQAASELGCHRSSLWRAGLSGGVDLPEVIRRVVVGYAACGYCGNWGEVAALLEMTPSGVAHRIRRTLCCTGSGATEKTFGEFLLWVAEAMAGAGGTSGGVEPEG